eukprot:7380708-Prymnesium_polylepis.1
MRTHLLGFAVIDRQTRHCMLNVTLAVCFAARLICTTREDLVAASEMREPVSRYITLHGTGTVQYCRSVHIYQSATILIVAHHNWGGAVAVILMNSRNGAKSQGQKSVFSLISHN